MYPLSQKKGSEARLGGGAWFLPWGRGKGDPPREGPPPGRDPEGPAQGGSEGRGILEKGDSVHGLPSTTPPCPLQLSGSDEQLEKVTPGSRPPFPGGTEEAAWDDPLPLHGVPPRLETPRSALTLSFRPDREDQAPRAHVGWLGSEDPPVPVM